MHPILQGVFPQQTPFIHLRSHPMSHPQFTSPPKMCLINCLQNPNTSKESSLRAICFHINKDLMMQGKRCAIPPRCNPHEVATFQPGKLSLQPMPTKKFLKADPTLPFFNKVSALRTKTFLSTQPDFAGLQNFYFHLTPPPGEGEVPGWTQGV